MEKLFSVYKLFKVKHYIKNLVIFLPAIFVKELGNTENILQIVKVFFAFCLMASAVYIFNDLQDYPTDKKHPIKCKRPIASGKILPAEAKVILASLLIIIAFLGQYLNAGCNICLWLYFLLNIGYSLKLKNIRFVDIICIAFGFVLRIAAGFNAIYLPLSLEIMAMVFITSVFFTISKRNLEQKFLPDTKSRRQSVQHVRPDLLVKLLYLSAIGSVISYIYVANEYSAYITGLKITIICFVAFIGRLLFLVNKTKSHDDPMNFIVSDKWTKIIAVFSLLILAVIYGG